MGAADIVCVVVQLLAVESNGSIAPLVPTAVEQPVAPLDRSPHATACVPPSETVCPAIVIEEFVSPALGMVAAAVHGLDPLQYI